MGDNEDNLHEDHKKHLMMSNEKTCEGKIRTNNYAGSLEENFLNI